MTTILDRRRVRGLAGRATLLTLLVVTTPAMAGAPVQLAQSQVPDDGEDESAMVLRVGRLEGQIRTLTGQVEQLQFQNKKLEDNLRKMQQDVDFRFQDLQGHGAPIGAARPVPQRRGDADAASAPAEDLSAAQPAVPATAHLARQNGDAFDPDADPAAPGAPRPLGTTTASAPLPTRMGAARDANAPLDLMQRPGLAPDTPDTAPTDEGGGMAAPDIARALPNPNTVASLVPGGTREEFDGDLGLYKQGQFDGAATGFQSFVEKYPKDRLVPDAVYLLGESYARLGRHREAAEQFLRLSTDYGKSARAPDAMLRLGMSLNALGAKDQACATYQEVNRRYPTASADVRAGVDRELKKSRCQG